MKKIGLFMAFFVLETLCAFQSVAASGTAPVALQKDQFNIDLENESPIKNQNQNQNQNSYIVVFSVPPFFDVGNSSPLGLNFVADRTQELSIEHQFTLQLQFSNCLFGFVGKMTSETAADLAQDPRIESVEPDLEVSIDQGNELNLHQNQAEIQKQVLPLGIQRIGADKSSDGAGNRKGTVDGVDIYVIDTGIQKNHPDLNVVGGKNFSDGDSYDDRNGHGTHVAGIAAAIDNSTFVVGVAPGAHLYAVRVLDGKGKGKISQVLAGVDWVTQQKMLHPERPVVANLSLGVKVNSTVYNAMDRGIKNSIAAGVVYTIAAGNDKSEVANFSPAHVSEALTVAAYDPANNHWAEFSNYGTLVDFLAPGVNVLSTFINSSTVRFSGTSMAAPHVAGVVALYLSQHPLDSPDQVRTALLRASLNPLPGPNVKILGVPAGTAGQSVYSGNF